MDKLEQIALEAQVSRNTILRVLRGGNKESRPTAIEKANQIRQIAQRIGYLPNGSARAMRLGRFNCLGLLLSTDRGRSHLPDGLFDSIHNELDRRHIRMVISKLPDEKLSDPKLLPSILKELCCDGLLINYTDHIPSSMTKLMRSLQLPSVWINSKHRDDSVYYDDRAGAAEATRHLISLGHRRVAYLDFVSRNGDSRQIHYSRTDRFEGYMSAMREAKLKPMPLDLFEGIEITRRMQATVEMLRSLQRPTAILSYDAGERILFAAALAGIRVPQDLSVMSFGYPHDPQQPTEFGESYIGMKLTRMTLPVHEAGRLAVNMLMNKIESSDSQKRTPSQVLPLSLESGETCTKAHDGARD